MSAGVLNAKLANSKPDEAISGMCLRMFSRYLPTSPASILDIGCGTGRDLDFLSSICSDCWGVDYLPEMIESARVQRSHLKLGDMRDIRLGRTFDVIMCMGSGLMYARSKEDVERILETFAAHAHIGTLLILDTLNAASFFGVGKLKEKTESGKSLPKFPTRDISFHSFDKRRQPLVKKRVWNIHGQPPVEDCCRYRSFFPNEIKHLLAGRGFRIVGIFDNIELKDSDLSGLKLYVGAIMSS